MRVRIGITRPIIIKALIRTSAALATMALVLFTMWTAGTSPAWAQQSIICSVSPTCTGLAVESLSVYATMPDAGGVQRVTTSFQVVNRGTMPSAATTTVVDAAGTHTLLDTPALQPGAAAFFGTTISTTATDFTITVQTGTGLTSTQGAVTPALSSGSYHFVSNQAAIGRWRPIGPSAIANGQGQPFEVGRITTIALDPSTTSTIYAGARGTGLWKTTDGGAHWEPLTDALPSVNIYAVAVDPAAPTHVFIATPAGVFRSTDGGHVWVLLTGRDLRALFNGFIVEDVVPVLPGALAATSTSSTTTNTTAALDPSLVSLGSTFSPLQTEVRLYLTTQDGLLLSRNGGVTWNPVVGTAGTSIVSLEQDRSNPKHLIATAVGGFSATGVYETFNGGLTASSWHLLQGCPGAALPVFPHTVALWATESGSTQWISVKHPALPNQNPQHDLYRTTAQTCTVNGIPERGWQLLSSGTDVPCISGAVSSYLRADPTNPQILYKSGINLCRSTDGGNTFQKVPIPHVDHHVLVFNALAPDLLLDGNDGGLYRSDDGGQSFYFDSLGLSVTEFLDFDRGGAAPRTVVGGSQDNAMSSSDLTSPLWNTVNLGGDPDGDRSSVVVDPADRTVQYTVGQAVNHLSRIQNGVRDQSSEWQWQPNDNPTAIDPFNGLPQHCLTYNESPELFTQFLASTSRTWHLLTTVGGPSQSGPYCNGGIWTGPPWQPLFAPSDGEVITRLAYDPSNHDANNNGLFLAGGNRGSIYINFDPTFMAQVWQAPLGPVTAIVPDPSRTANYFVSLGVPFGFPRIVELSPGGILHFNEQDITADLPPAEVLTLAANPFEPGVLYAGTKGHGVFRGVRDAATGQWSWQAFDNGMPPGTTVTKLRVNPHYGTIYAGTFGRGAFLLDTVSIF